LLFVIAAGHDIKLAMLTIRTSGPYVA